MKSLVVGKKYFKDGKLLTGFTLIELVISIFVLSFAIVGIFSAFSIMVILTADASNRLTATYLAQEGMEIVRNIRDTNWLKMDDCVANSINPCPYTWLSGIDNCVSGCEADYTTGTGVSGSFLMQTWAGRPLKNNTNGFYYYDENNGTETIFKRKIKIKPIMDVDEKSDHIIKVTVEASWKQKATILNDGFPADECHEGKNCIIAEETLYNWYNYSSAQE